MSRNGGRGLARTHVDFPEDWEILEAEGAGGFTTRVTYRRPDGSEHVWTSRRHRKGRGPRNRDAQGAKSLRRSPWLQLWAPGRISWWVAASFVLGSALFALGASSSLWFQSFLGGELASRIADWSYFLGATVFTGAIYLQILETVNADPHPVRARRRSDETFRWFAWQPRRLSYMEAFVLFVGSIFFNVETALALLGVSGKEGVNWLLSVPSFLGALLFVTGCYMQVVEACHRYLCLRPRSVSWWSATFNFLGCVGFLAGAVFGFQAPGLSTPADPTLVKAAYLQGSIFFLIGSYLMIPEMFSE
ncbi:MAG: hypothetical protein M3157_07960 [Actinomycetota bacterium]|nr:hypothetical protein [Actinomycetota bacterium]